MSPALVLSMGAVAIAAIPSKNAADMVVVEVVSGDTPRWFRILYDAVYGNVIMSFQLSTFYPEKGTVVVLMDIENPVTGEIKWYALNGFGVSTNGGSEVEFAPEILESLRMIRRLFQ